MIAITIIVVLAGTPLLLHLPFDFNPINLQNPNAPSVVTYRELQRNPETSGNDAEVLAPTLDQADVTAKRLGSPAGGVADADIEQLYSNRPGSEIRGHYFCFARPWIGAQTQTTTTCAVGPGLGGSDARDVGGSTESLR